MRRKEVASMGHARGWDRDFQSALRDEGFVQGLRTQGFVRCGELHPGLLPVAPPGLDSSRCTLATEEGRKDWARKRVDRA